MTADHGERLLTADEAAAILGVTDTSLKRWARSGKLPPKTVSRWSDQGHLPAAATTAGGHPEWSPTDVQRFAETYGLASEAGAWYIDACDGPTSHWAFGT